MLNYRPPAQSAAALHALGDPTRRAIVDRLSRGPATVTELAEPLAISRSAVLQHLSVLERGALVASEKRGRVRVCRLETAGLDAAAAWLTWHKRRWESRLDRLGYLLEEEQD